MSRWSGGTVAVACAVMAVWPAGARAGSLALLTCDGSGASDGWSAFIEDAPAGSAAVSTCSESRPGYPLGLEAYLPSGTVSDARAGLLFTAPAGESIAGGDITLAPQAPTDSGEGTYAVAQLAKPSPEYVFWQSVNLGVPPTVAIPAGGSELSASVLCGGAPGRICRSEALYVISAHILLSTSVLPSVSALAGSLTAGGLQHGTQNVSFTASDPGGPGIYQVAVAIDGKTIYQATPNLNGGACAPVGDYGGALEFYAAYPCPQTVPVSVPIPTGTLTDGIHSLSVNAIDAASELSSASQVIFRTENLISAAGAGRVPRGANSPGSAYLVRFDGRTATLLHGVRRSYVDSSLTLSGTLTTPQGAAAPDVPLQLLGRDGVDAGGAQMVLASTTTDAAGHWSLTAPRGPSRTLSVGYGQASALSQF